MRFKRKKDSGRPVRTRTAEDGTGSCRRTRPGLKGPVPLQLDQQQTDSRPDEFTDADKKGYEDTGTGGKSQTGDRHEEASLTATQLQGHEEGDVKARMRIQSR